MISFRGFYSSSFTKIMNQKFTKTEKLKRRKLIELLFTKGQSVKAFPLILVYKQVDLPEKVTIQAGFSVPKRNHKRAVARNRIKRMMREVYRKNKQGFKIQEGSYAFMIIYVGKTILPYGVMEQHLVKLTEKFNAKHTVNQESNLQK